MGIRIRKFRVSDSEKVSQLILKIFYEDNLKDVSEEGKDFFQNSHTPEHIKENWRNTYSIIAEENRKIVGIARGKKDGWNTHLFVDGKYRNRRIAIRLLRKIEEWQKRVGNNIVYLNSSPFALKFYERQDYKRKGRKKNYHGIPLYYMEKEIN